MIPTWLEITLIVVGGVGALVVLVLFLIVMAVHELGELEHELAEDRHW